MSIPSKPTKRRRLNDATSALSKPFKSPLKATDRLGAESGRADACQDHQQQQQQQQEKIQPTTTKRRLPTSHLSTPSASAAKSKLNQSSAHLQQSPQFLTLQKQHSALVLQLRTLRQSLDTAQQALEIASSSSDRDLESIITKWKLASREAAEEVFSGAKDRVVGMGGVGVWRERSRKKESSGWDGDEMKSGGRGKLDEEQRERWEMQREELHAERKKYEPEKVQEELSERDDDQSFTMDMMLRSLNIELDVIGYDKENQRWCD